MPQLIVLAIAGAGLLLGYKWLSRKAAERAEVERVREEAERRNAEVEERPKEMGQLEWDGDAGVYRPVRR